MEGRPAGVLNKPGQGQVPLDFDNTQKYRAHLMKTKPSGAAFEVLKDKFPKCIGRNQLIIYGSSTLLFFFADTQVAECEHLAGAYNVDQLI